MAPIAENTLNINKSKIKYIKRGIYIYIYMMF